MNTAATVTEELDELEVKLKRLKIEYEQYFGGGLKREPVLLKGEIERTIQRFLSTPPTGARYKFRFNSLVARYQCYRQLWGRTLREIEAGTYKGHQFRANARAGEKDQGPLEASRTAERPQAGVPIDDVKRLYDALARARAQTGESMGSLTPEKLGEIVSKQVAELRDRNPSAKVRFRVVRDGKRAQLRASVVKP